MLVAYLITFFQIYSSQSISNFSNLTLLSINRSTLNGAKPPKKKGETKKPTGLKTEPVSLLNPTPAPAQPKEAGKKKGAPKEAESSDSDQGAPVAEQMLSFVFDDPDFESEEVETPKIKKVGHSALV